MDNIPPCPPDANLKTEHLLREACVAEYMVKYHRTRPRREWNQVFFREEAYWKKELARLTNILFPV